MQADLLACAACGIRNILFVTGDPPKLGDYPHATGVFDADSIGMAAVQRRLNCGLDLGGQPIDPQTFAVIGVGLDPTALDRRRELDRFRQKVEAGAEFAITQPVFDPDALLRILDDVQRHGMPIVAGIWPLVSYRNALFMRNEVPGVVVPDAVMERMAAASQPRGAACRRASRSPRESVGPGPRPRGRHSGQRAAGQHRDGLGGVAIEAGGWRLEATGWRGEEAKGSRLRLRSALRDALRSRKRPVFSSPPASSLQPPFHCSPGRVPRGGTSMSFRPSRASQRPRTGRPVARTAARRPVPPPGPARLRAASPRSRPVAGPAWPAPSTDRPPPAAASPATPSEAGKDSRAARE